MKKKIIICVATAVVILATGIMILFPKNDGNTVSERESFLNTVASDINIVSEITVDDSIICHIQSRSKNGYAVFEANGSGYIYSQHLLSSETIVIDRIYVNDQFYQVLICNKPQLEKAEIVYSDPDSSKIIESQNIELNGNMMCVIESIKASSYTIDVTFYDTKGNIFNNSKEDNNK